MKYKYKNVKYRGGRRPFFKDFITWLAKESPLELFQDLHFSWLTLKLF